MRRAWALAASMLVVACVGTPADPVPEPVWWRTQPMGVGGDGLPRVLSADGVQVQAAVFGLEPSTLSAYAHWTLLVAPMQPNGGVSWRVQPSADAIWVCLERPAPGRPVTLALQAPALLVGQSFPKPVRNTGDCIPAQR
jgi:hypothetical protein